jgi:hypothetical protein
MTECKKKIDPPLVFTGHVTRYEASGARRFQFNLTEGRNELSFLLRDEPETSDPMFSTMASAVTGAYATKTGIEVTTYEQFEESGVFLVNIIRGA